MTCSLQPHLVVTFFHSSPFLVCLSGEKKLCLSNQTSLPTTFPVWKFIAWSCLSPNHHGEKTPPRPSQPRPSLVSHVLFIGTTCFHMGTIATGQACYFAEGASSFLKKNCGQTALMGCSWCPSCLYIGPTKKNHWVAYSAASRRILCMVVVGFFIGVVFILPILACLAFIICCFTLSRVSSWFNLSYPDISYVIFSSFLLSYLYVSIYTPKNQKL